MKLTINFNLVGGYGFGEVIHSNSESLGLTGLSRVKKKWLRERDSNLRPPD